MPKLSPDEKWSRFNKKLVELMKQGDFFSLGTTYYEMASFLKNEGKDDSKFRELGYKMKLKVANEELEGYKKSDVITKIEIMAVENSCALCKELNGKVFTLREALSLRPLPVKDCTYPYGCRCTYLPAVE